MIETDEFVAEQGPDLPEIGIEGRRNQEIEKDQKGKEIVGIENAETGNEVIEKEGIGNEWIGKEWIGNEVKGTGKEELKRKKDLEPGLHVIKRVGEIGVKNVKVTQTHLRMEILMLRMSPRRRVKRS
ncbi:uncharacterized protein LOC111716932 [Eurytemora carolleeae]|uniref:uncharacterized protein LOC111716932 n=1 Tax=Eurytemora carolleeae TaxID=1294199 RepID=UPI000C779C49|nr:uncharacterized protein LOC111716932 [Eurytemora carolleeae]|eukprot:XP_023348211.1 uncharacterized protein LOC111716932 [Eurytemora affinis]